MREERSKNGLFSLERKQFAFKIDEETHLPVDYVEQKRIGTKFMIEELMLLANRLVAEKIYKHIPQETILRVHRDFENKDVIANKLLEVGIKINLESQKTIADSLSAIK